ncbi:MAG: 1-(5-phosphoribosyl)-5-[(5-phosphoribosylamino)methylideneamino]imidazole-4-carboxamide isomerase [Bacteroidetes bacterium HGW-Bacteroidetes-4]|jgi:phosphoribosylformimino-5-aminoimidazole carboxamide ribotide isomerase|nr:MAG: 1-(5-phosphoribosyl)-5-[(5-phosphoribosylamino)methylideneamino]imidazole-4-carboxamide isomerase [Bacteroidetes bacterium HGW-Bacteroidetes-4]
MEIIPAIDIIGGKCVRLTFGDFNQQKVYNENPLEVAKKFEQAGIKRLHLVDLDGAKTGNIVNYKVLESICKNTHLTVDFGGGINTQNDLELAFNSGAQMITGGSVAVKQPGLFRQWLREYGSDRVILGADVRNQKIAIKGWQEDSDLNIRQLIQNYLPYGIKKVICTDISKDGAMQGPSFELYRQLIDEFPEQQFIASGGVTTLDDVQLLKEMGMYGIIIGKAIYEGSITLKELEKLVLDKPRQ